MLSAPYLATQAYTAAYVLVYTLWLVYTQQTATEYFIDWIKMKKPIKSESYCIYIKNQNRNNNLNKVFKFKVCLFLDGEPEIKSVRAAGEGGRHGKRDRGGRRY